MLGGTIAWHSAFQGKTLVVYDIAADALARCKLAHDQYAALYAADLGASDADIAAIRDRLTFATGLTGAVAGADLVIEAVPKVPDIKQPVYQGMADLLPLHMLVATNSSTLLPRDFAADAGRPEPFCSLHFVNGIWSMNVVELSGRPDPASVPLRRSSRSPSNTADSGQSSAHEPRKQAVPVTVRAVSRDFAGRPGQS